MVGFKQKKKWPPRMLGVDSPKHSEMAMHSDVVDAEAGFEPFDDATRLRLQLAVDCLLPSLRAS